MSAVDAGDINILLQLVGSSEFQAELQRTFNNAKAEAEAKFGAISTVVGGAMTAVGATITGAMGAAVADFAATGDAIQNMSEKTGMSTTAVSEWKHALEMTGGSLDSLRPATKAMTDLLDQAGTASKAFAAEQVKGSQEAAVKTRELSGDLTVASMKLQEMMHSGNASHSALAAQRLKCAELSQEMKSLGSSTEGTSGATDKASQTLSRMGLSIGNLKTMAPEKVFETMFVAVSSVKDPLERAALAQDVFGRGGVDLLPMLSQGAAGMRELRNEAHELGVVFNTADAALADQFSDDLERLGKSAKGVSMELARALMPAMIELMQTTKDVVLSVAGWMKANPELTATLSKVAAVVGGLMLTLGPLVMMMPGLVAAFTVAGPVIAAIGGAFLLIIGPVGLAIAAIAAVGIAIGLMVAYWDKLPGLFSSAWNAVTGTVARGMQTLGQMVGMGMAYVGWAFTNPLDAIQAAWGALVGFFQGVWAAITATFQVGWNIISGIFSAIQGAVGWLAENFGAGVGDGMNPVQGVPGMATGGTVAQGGWALVGERGPELVQLPTGSTVYDAQQTADARGSGGNTVTLQMTFNGDMKLDSPQSIRELSRQLADDVQTQLRGMGMGWA